MQIAYLFTLKKNLLVHLENIQKYSIMNIYLTP